MYDQDHPIRKLKDTYVKMAKITQINQTYYFGYIEIKMGRNITVLPYFKTYVGLVISIILMENIIGQGKRKCETGK